MKAEKTYSIRVTGLVQGVGFRPFIYRLAHRFGFPGWVENRNDGVLIRVKGDHRQVNAFMDNIRSEAPTAAVVSDIIYEEVGSEDLGPFSIIKSSSTSDAITEVSPDIAVCDDCLADLRSQAHRINYPFINCTNCGPRFSIIRDLPYDRHKTTMEPFEMCPVCRAEYEDVLDRRFHAQPVACSSCGPEYELVEDGVSTHGTDQIIDRSADLLATGKILAIKGIGGFQLACNAQDEEAVSRLRQRKHREGKPFAVMFRDMATLQEYATIFPEEQRSLESWRRPIVLVAGKKRLAPAVGAGFRTVGAMLPYMPFHYLLFEKLDLPAIVLTSGNISDEPIVIDNGVAVDSLSAVADAVVAYNRDIHNRTDDSVVMVVQEKERVLRRSRGYSPSPVNLGIDVDGIFAAGAELVNCFALGKGRQAILSQHIGDLKNLETLEFFSESFERYKKLFRAEPALVVHDMHPDYLSTRFARELGLPAIEVQHHHAHIASAMAEHGLDERVMGISMDGTGLGDDGNIWGGEFLICDLAAYQRFSHFDYVPLPGGDRVTHEPWRTGVAYLERYLGGSALEEEWPFLEGIDRTHVSLVLEAIGKKINTPLSSSAGRLFDAVSAILGLCSRSKFHAEAPMRLEAAIAPGIEEAYPFEMGETVSFGPAFEALVYDLRRGEEAGRLAARFHNTFINALLGMAHEMRKSTGLEKVVLSGGTFQNRYVLGRLESKLRRDGFRVYTQNAIPANDGGIALGQLAVAAKKRQLGSKY